MMIEFSGKELSLEKVTLSLPYSILDAEALDGRIFVVYDYMEFPMDAPARNLVCIDESGKELWVAGNPTKNNNDGYTNFNRTDKPIDCCIAANNFAGYTCQVNKFTGELANVLFTK
jgi:hypothetical protein